MHPQPLPGAGPVGPTRRRPRFSPLAVLASVLLVLGSIGVAVFVFLSGGALSAVISIALAAVSVPLLVLVCLWLDRYEPEPRRYLVAAFGWGATAAAAIGAGLSLLLAYLTQTPELTLTTVWAPLTEEFAKGLFLVLIVGLRRQQMHGILDGIVYAALAGIGFAFTENVLYYVSALMTGGIPGVTGTFVLRGIVGPFAHPLFTAAIGVGVGIAISTRRPAVRVLAPLAGYVVAVGLHGLWNGSVVVGGLEGFVAAYVLGMLPMLVLLVLIGVWARRREARMLTFALEQCAAMGWIQLDEITWVAKMDRRVTARHHAQLTGGPGAKWAVSDYQQTLIEMAFLHGRVTHGTPPVDVNARMAAILLRAASIRPYVRWPMPPPRSLPPRVA